MTLLSVFKWAVSDDYPTEFITITDIDLQNLRVSTEYVDDFVKLHMLPMHIKFNSVGVLWYNVSQSILTLYYVTKIFKCVGSFPQVG